jgi:cell division protein FtsI (penicillin-binding protein 3)
VMNEGDGSTTADSDKPAPAAPAGTGKDALMKEASLRQPADTLAVAVTASANQASDAVPAAAATPGSGTAILEVNGGVVVPSFVGKTLRNAVESAQQTGIEISIVGSGIAREQFPAPGSHLLAGQRVTVRFSR